MNHATEITSERASFEHRADGWKVILVRELGHPVASVWAWLTDSQKLKEWLAPGEIDLKPGGRVRIDFGASGETIDSHVLEIEAERKLAYSWSHGDRPQRPVRWSLQPQGEQTRLTLTLELLPDDPAAISAAGWDAHLEMLEATMEGVSISFPVARFKESRVQFEECLEIPPVPAQAGA